jgi:N-acetylmuramoyl-L-alanine amidase
MGVKRNSTAPTAQIPNKIQCLIWMAAALALLFCCTNNALAGSPNAEAPGAIIALDPGHGGSNQGARGPTGLLEKEVSLTLARELATALEASGYAVVLTRSDDYDVPLRNRTAIANHHKADLFISVHTAASYMHAASGITIHHYRPPEVPSAKQHPFPQKNPPQSKAWHQIQLDYRTQSRELAQTMARTMDMVWPSATVEVSEVPLVVLEGADMPAVLIEVGYLSNPADEKNLDNPTYRATFVQALVRSIDTYLSTHP